MKAMTRIAATAMIGVLAVGSQAVTAQSLSRSPENESSTRQVAPQNGPLAEHQGELLDLAMGAASKLPIDPHIKNRSRLQHQVAEAALKLDQPRRALDHMERIDNWRRGAVAADYVLYCARAGHTETVGRYTRIARAAAKLADQDWRREYIQLRIAQARLVLGETQPADEFKEKVQSDVFRGVIEQAEAEQRGADDFDQVTQRLDHLLDAERYELILNGAAAYVTLYKQHYHDETRRDAITTRLREAYKNMPGPETINLLVMLAEAALEREDSTQALAFLTEADDVAAEVSWPATREYEYVYLSRLATLRHQAGDREGARAAIDEASEKLHERLPDIVNIWRADALRPVAEAYEALGEREQAEACYRQAIDAGMENPNGRPRAEDLVKTCISMAVSGFEPDEPTWGRLHEANDRLSAPW